jgi:ribonucleotide reductase beta subunit family protein with ferritin-like domain
MKKILVLLSLVLAFSIQAKEAVSAGAKKAMVKALTENEKLHMAYFNYDTQKIVTSRDKFVKDLKSVKDKKLQAKLKKAISYLEKISKANDKEKNNKYYHYANVYLIQLVEKFDFHKNYQPYYCPMVRKKWIQNISKIEKVHNPYDPSMPHCGGRL